MLLPSLIHVDPGLECLFGGGVGGGWVNMNLILRNDGSVTNEHEAFHSKPFSCHHTNGRDPGASHFPRQFHFAQYRVNPSQSEARIAF